MHMNERLNAPHRPAHLTCRLLLAGSAGLFATVLALPAMAYVGPGAGLGVLGTLLAVIIATLATVVGLVLWPVRALARRLKARRGETSANATKAEGSAE
jgi:hypothetical protein